MVHWIGKTTHLQVTKFLLLTFRLDCFIECKSMLFNIISVDLRARPLEQAKHWKNERLAARAQFDTSAASTAAFMLSNVTEDDDGIYRCRVDFRHTPTRHVRYQLNVVRKSFTSIDYQLKITVVGAFGCKWFDFLISIRTRWIVDCNQERFLCDEGSETWGDWRLRACCYMA